MSKAGTNHVNGHGKTAGAARTSRSSSTRSTATNGRRHSAVPRSTTASHAAAEHSNGRANGRSTVRSNMLELDERIKSEFAASREIQARILEMVSRNKFTPHSFFAIKLALEEAMINAIKHGNKLDASKHVHIKAKITPKVAEISIEDEGPGFVRKEVPDPTLIENLEKCSGRGIMLIESYMNDVEWTHKGRRLKMCKRNGEEAR